VAGDGRYVGDFYGMMVAHGGLEPARGVLGAMCATQAPGLILAVHRPDDIQRDSWCVARYQEVDGAETIRIGRQP
jgi:hypothetical protein